MNKRMMVEQSKVWIWSKVRYRRRVDLGNDNHGPRHLRLTSRKRRKPFELVGRGGIVFSSLLFDTYRIGNVSSVYSMQSGATSILASHSSTKRAGGFIGLSLARYKYEHSAVSMVRVVRYLGSCLGMHGIEAASILPDTSFGLARRGKREITAASTWMAGAILC